MMLSSVNVKIWDVQHVAQVMSYAFLECQATW